MNSGQAATSLEIVAADENKTQKELLAELGDLRRQLQESRESEAKHLLDLTQTLAKSGHWRVDLTNQSLFWSSEIYAIHGLDPDSYVPVLAASIDHYHPDDREQVRQCISRAMQDKEDFDFELRIIRSDGEVRQVLSRGRPELNEEGEVSSIIGILQDISDRKREEIKLLRSNERLRAHLENTLVGVIEWDLDFRVVAWNARCEEIFGYTKEEAMGRHAIEIVVPPAFHALVAELFQNMLAQTGGTHSRNDSITKSGATITCDWYNTTLLDSEGKPVGVASICQDITEHKELEARLVHSQKMEAIGTLAGGVAHDMNNVLAVVLGLGSLVEEALPASDYMKLDMQDILAAARRGKAMVINLLGFARKGAYARTRWSPSVVLECLVELLRKTIPKEISTQATLSEEVDDVIGDRDQITTALMNLCINASQAIDGHGTITIAADNVALGQKRHKDLQHLDPGRYVRLQVVDNGTGMNEATLERACEPFFTTKDIGEGTGLGLSMVYGAVRGHGGSLSIESAPGKGTSVTILLPAAQEKLPAPHIDEASLSGGSGTVLIIDDEEMILRSMSRMLEASGYAIIAEGGQGGLERFRESHSSIDLVLLDVSMPGLHGAECFQVLQEIDSSVPVVICTGHGDEDRTSHMLAAGAACVLRKPFELAELDRLLARLLS